MRRIKIVNTQNLCIGFCGQPISFCCLAEGLPEGLRDAEAETDMNKAVNDVFLASYGHVVDVIITIHL